MNIIDGGFAHIISVININSYIFLVTEWLYYVYLISEISIEKTLITRSYNGFQYNIWYTLTNCCVYANIHCWLIMLTFIIHIVTLSIVMANKHEYFLLSVYVKFISFMYIRISMGRKCTEFLYLGLFIRD